MNSNFLYLVRHLSILKFRNLEDMDSRVRLHGFPSYGSVSSKRVVRQHVSNNPPPPVPAPKGPQNLWSPLGFPFKCQIPRTPLPPKKTQKSNNMSTCPLPPKNKTNPTTCQLAPSPPGEKNNSCQLAFQLTQPQSPTDFASRQRPSCWPASSRWKNWSKSISRRTPNTKSSGLTGEAWNGPSTLPFPSPGIRIPLICLCTLPTSR